LRRGQAAVARAVVLGQPDGVEAEVLGVLDLVEHLVVGAFEVTVRRLDHVEDAELHPPTALPSRRFASTLGATSRMKYSTRREPLSTLSPGSCAQKKTSSICGRSRSSLVSSATA